MKASILVSAFIIVGVTTFSAGENNHATKQLNLDNLYACGWFPLCTDPDNYSPVTILVDKNDNSSKADENSLLQVA
ncbi:hypothetical protein HRH59_00275 [Rheinheimera sp. YQF-2]|uniref:Uncharacterized protein n=1 Tax=Rheinheimera lutimaris TaxID=2740584 RepID=A0A7Y5EG69_9GAMM|nr:hypothetical protein [Rheinheimera lutimaris]NRQ41009.1 hypothetical protein [Rheinheimera lutimaris]